MNIIYNKALLDKSSISSFSGNLFGVLSARLGMERFAADLINASLSVDISLVLERASCVSW